MRRIWKAAEQVLEFLIRSDVEDAGYTPGSDVVFAIDAAASELYDEDREGVLFSRGEPDAGK